MEPQCSRKVVVDQRRSRSKRGKRTCHVQQTRVTRKPKQPAIPTPLRLKRRVALGNAIDSPPALPEILADPIERIKVMETDVKRGGIAGFNRIFVRVRRITPAPKQARRAYRSRKQ